MKIKQLAHAARPPVYATSGAGCFDLSSTRDAVVPPGEAATFPTGWAFEVPEGHVMLLFSRSGHGFNYGVRLANCVGVVDADYRGEVPVRIHNDSATDFHVKVGDRIAQALVIPAQQMTFEIVEQLSSTARGSNGFGSTN